jgi:hypothetical protein
MAAKWPAKAPCCCTNPTRLHRGRAGYLPGKHTPCSGCYDGERDQLVELPEQDIAHRDLIRLAFDLEGDETWLVFDRVFIVIDEDRHPPAVHDMHHHAAARDDLVVRWPWYIFPQLSGEPASSNQAVPAKDRAQMFPLWANDVLTSDPKNAILVSYADP